MIENRVLLRSVRILKYKVFKCLSYALVIGFVTGVDILWFLLN